MSVSEDEYDEACAETLRMMHVSSPTHYQGKGLQAIDVIEDFSLGFNLGNSIKYILRAGKKGDRIQDLKKAIWYLERECNSEV